MNLLIYCQPVCQYLKNHAFINSSLFFGREFYMFRKLLSLLMFLIVINPSLTAALHDLFEVGSLIEKDGNITIACAACLSQYSCESFFGRIWGNKQREDVQFLKKLLEDKQSDKIANFMLKISNDNQFMCMKCKKYSGWALLPSGTVVQENFESAQSSCLRRILASAFYSSKIGKKFYKTIKRLKTVVQKHSSFKQEDDDNDDDDKEKKLPSYKEKKLPSYNVSSGMKGVYSSWPKDYRLPQLGRGVIRFTTKMHENITIGLSPERGTSDSMYEVALGVDGQVVLRTQPQGSAVVSVDYVITDPITVEISVDRFTQKLFIKKVFDNGHKTTILEYDNFDSPDIRYFSFTGVSKGGHIFDIQTNQLIYPALKSFDSIVSGSVVVIESVENNKYLRIDNEGFVRAELSPKHVGKHSHGWFTLVTDGTEVFFDVFDQCKMLASMPQESSDPYPYVLQSVINATGNSAIFTLDFSHHHHIVYIKSLATNGYWTNPHGGKITTANHDEEPAKKDSFAKFKIRVVEVI